ncbi:MAG: ABC transporter ATP-binding protein [Actinomycetota bacterium]
MSAIAMRGVVKRFGDFTAIDNLDLTVPDGQICGILGPNGAGKTTTILMVLGIITPDQGRIQILGHNYPAERTEAIVQTGYWASYLGLPGKLKVREMLGVFNDLYGGPRRAIDEAIQLVGIEHLLGKVPSEMSSGQKTLVGMARTIVGNPRLLILDEPTASLDPEVAERLRRIIGDLHAQRGMTVLITSHNMQDIERLCSRVVFLANGRIVADDSPGALVSRYGDMEQSFLRIAEMSRANDAAIPAERVKEGT